ncbi:MAG TPA: hypothetical protein VKB77_16000 [Terriglobales bacterium]|nr:hypothetical protein [Terriglobales bacterium]
MAEGPILVYGYPVSGSGPVDPGYGVGHPLPPHAGHPLPLPSLPPGVAAPPIALPPTMWPPPGPPSPPVVVPEPPEKPLPGPPAVIWPPLPPGTGVAGKALILIWVVGVGYRWLVYEGHDIWPPEGGGGGGKPPETAQPKRS